MNTITQTLPLALRAGSHGETARAARGFGAAEAGAIDKVQSRFIALVESLQAQGSTGTRGQAGSEGAPQLRAPNPARIDRALDAAGIPKSERLSPQAALLALVGAVGKLLGNTSMEQLQANSKLRGDALAARGERAAQLAAAMEAALAAEQAAADAVDAASQAALEAMAAAEAARAEVDRLQQELDGLDPQDPQYETLRAAKEAELAGARQAAAAKGEAAEHAGEALIARTASYTQAVAVANDVRARIDAFNREEPMGLRPPEADIGSRGARMHALIGLLSQIMSDASLDKLKSDSELVLKQLESSQKEQLRLAKEQEDELERARAAESKSGCFGKAFGWVGKALAVVGSVAAIAVGTLTANPLLVVAGTVGLLMTVDSIQAEFTGFSVMGKAVEGLSRITSGLLVAFGVDRALAEKIGTLVATVQVMVAMIAASLVAGNISGVASQVGRMATLAKQAVEVVQVLSQLASLTSSVIHSVGNYIVAGIQVNIAKLLAQLEKLMLGDAIIRELLHMVQEAATQLSRTGLDLMVKSSDILAEEAATSRQVLAHIRTTA